MSEEQFLNLPRGQQIKLLSSFSIRGTFWLTPMACLNGFEEDMDTYVNTTPTSCNVGSSAMPSSTMPEIETRKGGDVVDEDEDRIDEDDTTDVDTVNGNTPPSKRYKRKLGDSIEASPGTTSSSKFRRTS
jgi:hypothetical protein